MICEGRSRRSIARILTVCLALSAGIFESCMPWPAATASIAAIKNEAEDDLLSRDAALLSALFLLGANFGASVSAPPCGGATFCSLFKSTTGSGGAGFGGVTFADAQCAAEKPAGLPGVGTDYKAILMSAGVSSTPGRDLNTNWVLYASMEYRREDGMVIATTNSSREFPTPLTNSPDTAFGNMFTGIDASGANWVIGQTCTDWTNGAGNYHTGIANNTTQAFDTGAPATCGAGALFYCAQQ